MGSELLVERVEWTGEEGSSNGQLDLELTLRQPGQTVDDVERKVSSLLSSFGNRRVGSNAKWTGEEGSSNVQLNLELTLRPPGPTAEDVERELCSFLSSFGNRRVFPNVLKKTTMELQLDVASTAKLFKIQGVMRDIRGRPTQAYRAKDVLLKRVAKWERDQTRADEVIRLATALRIITRSVERERQGVVRRVG
jgi:hypothetical protein